MTDLELEKIIAEDLNAMGPRFEKKDYQISVEGKPVHCEIGYEEVSEERRELGISAELNTAKAVRIFDALYQQLDPSTRIKLRVRGGPNGSPVYGNHEAGSKVAGEYIRRGFAVLDHDADEGGFKFELEGDLCIIEKELLSKGAWVIEPIVFNSGNNVRVTLQYPKMLKRNETSKIRMSIIGNKGELIDYAGIFRLAVGRAYSDEFKIMQEYLD